MAKHKTNWDNAFDAYQMEVLRYAQLDTGDTQKLMDLAALEIASEAGEVCGLFYKHVHQGHPLDKHKMIEELGDVMWGLALMSFMLGIDLSKVAAYNVYKLGQRYPKGKFSVEDSIRRADHDDSGI